MNDTNNVVTTLSASAILLDWVSGMGATGKEPVGTWEHVEEGKLLGQTVSLSLLTAIAEMKCKGSLPSFVNAIASGYISPNHLSQHKVGTPSAKVDKTFDTRKSVLTSEQFWTNCIKLGLDVKNVDTVSNLVEQVYKVTEKTTKTDLIILVNAFTELFVNVEQHGTYSRMVTSEELAAAKFASLTQAGYTDIREVAAGRYCSNLAITALANIGILADNSFMLVGTMALPDGVTFQVTFKDIEVNV
jgi:hypothetical protein